MPFASWRNPLFDADQRTCTRLRRRSPVPCRRSMRGAIPYVQVGVERRLLSGPDQRVHPEPHVRCRRAPGAMEEYYRVGNPDGKDRRAIFGEPMRAVPAFREPAPRLSSWTSWASRGP